MRLTLSERHRAISRLAPSGTAPLSNPDGAFHQAQPVTLLKPINGAGQILRVQLGDQSAEYFFGIARSLLKIFADDLARFCVSSK